jgi:amino acid permease
VNIFGRVMGFIVELNILVFCFGTAVAYIIAVGDILEPVLIMTGLDRQILGIKTKETSWMSLSTNNHVENTFSPSSSSSSLEDGLTSSQIHTLRVLSMVTFFTLIMFPLSLLEKINSLRFTSFFGVAAIIYLVFSTGLSSIQYLIQFGYTESWGKAPMFIMDGFRLEL